MKSEGHHLVDDGDEAHPERVAAPLLVLLLLLVRGGARVLPTPLPAPPTGPALQRCRVDQEVV